MVNGVALFNWDYKIGAVLEIQFPQSFNVDLMLLNKIYMTHSYEEGYKNEELIEISYEDKIILTYCDKTRVPTHGYEILLLMLPEKEKPNIFKIKEQFLKFSKNLFRFSREERKKFFLQNAKSLLPKPSAKKIVLLGRAGTGKTSIKKILFEGYPPKELLYNPLEPTRGIIPSVYSWFDLDLGLFDTAGQELNFLLQDEEEQARAFENADVVIYLVDYLIWVAKKKTIIQEIKIIQSIFKKLNLKTRLIIFLHKVDLINKESRELETDSIQEEVKNQLGLKIYFTSIYPDLIYSLYNAFYEILSSFSIQTAFLKETIDDIIKDFPKVMCFITNQFNTIVMQTMTPDFPINLINHSHRFIVQLNRTFQDMTDKDEISYLLISGKKNLNIIMDELNITRYNLNNLICISDALNASKLINLAEEIRLKINDIYYLNK
ncbi:MAG: GTPase [Promethearchaeota archaeon]